MPTTPAPVSDFHFKDTACKEPIPTNQPRAASGRVGPYELLEEIARGGMGIVCKARDTRQERIVALKMMRADLISSSEEVARRFRREAEAVAQLQHRHIVPIHELGLQGEPFYIAMDFVAGGTLDRHLKRFLADHRLAVTTIEKVARGVQHAHERGILHRDLKPGNVLLDEQGEPMITDFGLAKFTTTNLDLTGPGEVLGTPSYMSPEQAAGRNDRIGPATDIWGLGVLLFELLTGCRPFPGTDRTQILQKIQTTEPLTPRSVHPVLAPGLEAIIMRCLEKDPGQRYPTAADLAEDLQHWLHAEPVTALVKYRQRRRPHRQLSLALRAALALLLLTGGLLWLLPTEKSAKEGPSAGGTVKVLPATSPDPAADEQLTLLFQRLAQGETIELLERGQLPPWHRWQTEQTRHVDFHPLSFDAYAPALLELLPRVPIDSYRIRLEVSAHSIELGEIGFFFGHHSGNGMERPEHLFCTLAYSQTPYLDRVALGVHRYLEQDLGRSGVFHRNVLARGPISEKQAAADWRRLAIEVTPTTIEASWEGNSIGQFPRADLSLPCRSLAALQPKLKQVPELSVDGAVGLYLSKGSGTFRSLTIEPLK